MSNPKLETLNSKQTQISKVSNSKLYELEDKFFQLMKSQNYLLSFIFWICLGFRALCLEFEQFRISIFEFRIFKLQTLLGFPVSRGLGCNHE
jgi:hypothetical protein